LAITLDETATAVATKTVKLFKTSDLVNAVASLDVSTATVVGKNFYVYSPSELVHFTDYAVSVDAGAVVDLYVIPRWQ